LVIALRNSVVVELVVELVVVVVELVIVVQSP
jgi:hypothetical protein